MAIIDEAQVNLCVDTYDLTLTAEEAAEKVGCKAVLPKNNQLQLDIDTEEQYNLFQVRLTEFDRHTDWWVEVDNKPSKSGLPHRHITLTLTDTEGNPIELDEWQRIALQTILGSDLIRETLNAWRLLQGQENPSRLFEKIEQDNQ